MLISEKQHQANRRNAQSATGPKTGEGKAAVRFNALTWGLRARNLMLDHDDPKDYQMLWDALEAEWHPETPTERHYIEQMCIAQWLLMRVAESERRVLDANLPIEREFKLIDRVDARRVRLERTFTSSLRELQQLRRQRQAQTAAAERPQTKPVALPVSARLEPLNAPVPAPASAPPMDASRPAFNCLRFDRPDSQPAGSPLDRTMD